MKPEIAFLIAFATAAVVATIMAAVGSRRHYHRGYAKGYSAGQDAMLKAWTPPRVIVPEPLFLDRRQSVGKLMFGADPARGEPGVIVTIRGGDGKIIIAESSYFDGDGLLHEDDFKPTAIA